MKSIYISGQRKKKGHVGKIFLAFLILAILVVILRIISPYVLRDKINNAGADEKGYSYRVGDVNFEFLKGVFYLKDLRVFHPSSKNNIVFMNQLKITLDWREFLTEEHRYKLESDQVDVLLSKDLVQEIQRIKQEAKARESEDLYLEKINVLIKTFNFREMDNELIRTILTLKDVDLTIRNIGLGKTYDNSQFMVKSKIHEGGSLNLEGKTQVTHGTRSWDISGNLAKIPSTVLEKLAGDKKGEMDLVKTKVDAVIEAKSEDGVIQGALFSSIKDFQFSETKKQGLIKRGLSRITNMVLKDKLEEDGSLKLSIPFKLNENLLLEVPEPLRKLED